MQHNKLPCGIPFTRFLKTLKIYSLFLLLFDVRQNKMNKINETPLSLYWCNSLRILCLQAVSHAFYMSKKTAIAWFFLAICCLIEFSNCIIGSFTLIMQSMRTLYSGTYFVPGYWVVTSALTGTLGGGSSAHRMFCLDYHYRLWRGCCDTKGTKNSLTVALLGELHPGPWLSPLILWPRPNDTVARLNRDLWCTTSQQKISALSAL